MIERTYIKEVIRDGNKIWKLKCPKCGVWTQIDDDQLNGRVSVLCDCGFHETAKWIESSCILIWDILRREWKEGQCEA